MGKYGVKIKAILRCNDKFLIFKKWYDDRIEEPYQWEFIDTELEDGETAETACLRVVLESTGMYAAKVSMAYSWVYSLGDNQYLGLALLCDVPDELVILSEDLYDYKWVKTGEMPEYITNQFIIKDMKRSQII